MGSFAYTAITSAGKETKGMITANSYEAAVSEVRGKGLTLISMDEPNALNKDIDIAFLDKKPSARDMSVFCRSFVSILDAGVSVIAALEMLGEQTENKKLSRAIRETKRSIEIGETLSEAMGRHVDIFSPMFITLVAAGEASGSLHNSLARMADQFEKNARLKALIKKATVYPIVVASVAVVVVIAMLTFIIPKFEDMFKDMGTELPAITKSVVAASEFMQGYWYIVLGCIVGLVLLFGIFKKSRAGSYLFAKLGIVLPVVGKLTLKQSSARLARTLSTLLGSGLPLIEALEISANTMTNAIFKDALLDAKDDVAIGSPLSEAVEKSNLFPSMFHHMLSIGEETGNIDGMLTKLAEYYEEEVEEATQQLAALMEPMIIIVLAGVIGFLVIACLSPMMSMYEGLDNL